MIQAIINYLYRYPKSKLRLYERFGGYGAYRKMIKNRQRMEVSAFTLPPIYSFADGLPIYFLTGKKYLYQTLFCIKSLCNHTDDRFKFILVDDGSFDGALVKAIRQQLPGVTIIEDDAIRKNLDEVLPAEKYPHLREKRKIYPHLRKLTDIHTIKQAGWKLVLDSDMLFWNTPSEMINWLHAPFTPIHMLDCVESYGYSRPLMEQLCGKPVPALLNVGVIGLNGQQINWEDLDRWIKELEEREGASYYLEQALTAMLIGSKPASILNREQYKANPDNLNDQAILHHYVDVSKKIYFNDSWRKLIN